MTIVAFDGKILAADRQMSCSGMARPMMKIMKHGAVLLAFTGTVSTALTMRKWYMGGAVEKEFPSFADGDSAELIVIGKRTIFVYEGCATAVPLAYGPCAFGSGRDFAEAALYLGKSAADAVLVACHFQIDCGLGVDTLKV